MGLLEHRARAAEDLERAEPVRANEALEPGLVVTVRELGETDVDLGEIELAAVQHAGDHLRRGLADPDLAVLRDDDDEDLGAVETGVQEGHQHGSLLADDRVRVEVRGEHVLADGARRDDAEQVLGEAGHVDEAVVAEHLREWDGPLLGQPWNRVLEHVPPFDCASGKRGLFPELYAEARWCSAQSSCPLSYRGRHGRGR